MLTVPSSLRIRDVWSKRGTRRLCPVVSGVIGPIMGGIWGNVWRGSVGYSDNQGQGDMDV
jgi:hypothetical protein